MCYQYNITIEGGTCMDIKQLTDFVAVVNHGTLTAAAKSLHLSEPPLSVQIHQLEGELNCILFDRSARRMQLTEAGRLLYERATVILDLCNSTKREMADYLSGDTGTLRIGVTSSICNALFLEWMKRFHTVCPGIRFELQEENTYQLLEAVRSGLVELAFVRTPFSAADLQSTPLRRESLCAVALPEMLPKKAITLQELSFMPLLLTRRWEAVLQDTLHREQLEPQIVCLADDTRTIVRMAEEGLGVGIVPQSVLPSCKVSPVQANVLHQPELQSEICAVNRRDAYLSTAAQRFLEIAKQVQGTTGAVE
mgnify:FL=1